MTINFKISSKNPEKLSQALRETDLSHSENIRYYISVGDITESIVYGRISFESSYQVSDVILKEKAKETLTSQLAPYAFVSRDQYKIEITDITI